MKAGDKGRCNCRVCRYGTEITALAARQANKEDKKRVTDLYETMALVEDDNSMYRGRWTQMKDLLCLLRKDHFLAKGDALRLDGHEDCKICDLLEQLI